MTDDPRLRELLLRWHNERPLGRPPSAETLCAECSDLVDELKRRMEALQAARLCSVTR